MNRAAIRANQRKLIILDFLFLEHPDHHDPHHGSQ